MSFAATAVPLPTLNWVRLALAPVLVLIVTCLDRGYQTDFWQHLARGRLIVETREVVSTDRFTFTVPGRAMRDNNWLTQLLYYGLYTRGGIELVQVVNAVALAAAVGGVVALCWRASRSSGLAAAGGVVVFLGLWQTFLIRPQSLSLGLFVALFALLKAGRRDRRWLVVAPVMMSLWANLHGGFAIGLLLVGAFTAAWGLEAVGALVRRRGLSGATKLDLAEQTPWADLGGDEQRREERRRALLTFGAMCVALICSVLATLLNPYGIDVYRYAADLSRLGLERGIEEWLPPGPELWVSRVFYASLLMMVGLLIFSRQRLTAREVCLIACFLPPALVAVRMVPWWLLATTPTLVRLAAGALWGAAAIRGKRPTAPCREGEAPAWEGEAPAEPRSTTADDAFEPLVAARREARPPFIRRLHVFQHGGRTVESPRPSFAAGAVLACMLLAVGISLPWFDHINPVMGTLRPSARAEASVQDVTERVLLASPRPVRVFSRMEAGNYLCWALGAKGAVFIEGHVELYPDPLWEEYLTVSSGGAGWDRVLDKYAVDTLLLDAAYHDPLVRRVRRSGGWVEVGRSGDSLLFERRSMREFADDQDFLQKGAADGR